MNASQSLIDGRPSLDLFQMVAEYNLYLVRYIHHSWLTTIKLSPLVKQLRQGGNADYHLSHYLLGQFKLSNEFDYEFDLPVKKVALADEEAITRLAFYLGIILNEDVIRGVVRKQERQALEALLGSDGYRFAVKKAQFISRAASQTGPSILIDWDHLDRFKNYLLSTGFQVLGKAYSTMPDSFKKRLELKLPAEYSETLSNYETMPLSDEQCAALVVKTHKEVNREWRHLLS